MSLKKCLASTRKHLAAEDVAAIKAAIGPMTDDLAREAEIEAVLSVVRELLETRALVIAQIEPELLATLTPEPVVETAPETAEVVTEAAKATEVAPPPSLTEAIEQAAPQIEEAARAAVEAIAPPAQEAAAEPAAPAIDDATRSRFSEVLASKERRSNWAKAAGISEEQAQALIAEALADGRLRMLKGNVVRTAKARAAAPATPLAAEATEATSVPMGRAAERRLESIQDDAAYRAAAKLLANAGKPRKVKAILKDARKGLKRGQADQILNALAPGVPRPKNIGLVFDAIEKAIGDPNAVTPALRDDAGQVPEGSVSEGVRPDGEIGGTPAAPRDDLGGSVGDVGRSDGADEQQSGTAGVVPGTGEGVGSDTGGGPRDGERGTDTPAAPETGLTDEQKAEVEAQVRTDAEKLEQTRRDRESKNYQITDADEIGKGGPKAKVRGNIAAIKRLRDIQDTGREVTDEDKKVLVKYVGWGMFSQDVFRDHKPEWKAERDQIKDLLTPTEYAAARASTLNAHYTSPEVINAMWDGMRHLGFKGGRALEPAAGIGHYIGLTPADLRAETSWTAVELDPISAGITKALYGAADVRSAGFETQKWPDDHFDLAISNVPFGDFNLEEGDIKGHFIHDFFFVKSLRKVRPGGIVAFITSKGTLDKENGRARTAMSEHAKFLGAVRLPGGNQGAFKANAGTEVTTDIIFFRKRVPGEPAEETHDWRSLTEIKTPEGPAKINSYFAANPDMMLGKMRLKGTMYSAGEPVLIGSTENLGPKILAAIESGLPENAMLPKNTTAVELSAEIDTATDGIKEGAFYEKDGTLYRKIIGVGQPQKLNATDKSKVRAFIGIRNVVNQILAKQAQGDAGGMDGLRNTLTKAYDAFVKTHGPINTTITTVQKRKDGKEITVKRRPTMKLFEDDPDAFKVSAIEVYDEKTGKAKKSAIFTEDIVGAYVAPDVKGPSDALAVSLNEKGKVDIELIASRLGVSEAEATVSLGDQIYLSPNGEQWQTRAEYLSGDVVEKLEVAKVAAELDPGRYMRNVEALEAVQPEPLTRQEITIPFGAPWVPAEVYQDFLRAKVGATYNIKVSYNPKNARWTIVSGGFDAGARENFGTSEKDVDKIIEYALNSESIIITHKDREGNAVRQPEAEQEARARVDAIRELFSGDPEAGVDGWVWEDDARAERLEAMYNRNYNRLVPQDYDGKHMTFPGLATIVTFPDGSTGKINRDPHRVNAIWRIIQKGNTLLNHVVGSGKTWTSIMAAMEMKRLGMIQRPMFVVPNHMLNQFSTEFYQAYPNAKLLIATKDQMSSKRRREFAAKAAADKWDGIIITHSAFTRIGMQPQAYTEFYTQQIEEMVAAIEQAAIDEGKDSKTVKDLEKARKRLETKLKNLADEASKDVGVTFEELGVDHLTVDEVHLFKSLQFATRHTRVKGISNKGESKRATDLFIKMRHLEKSRPGRSAVFLTGTPVSNTMAELFTMQRYLQEGTLRKYGIAQFDSWAATFGKIVTKSELGSNSRDYVDTESFSQFVNMPELMAIVGDVMDTQTADMLKLPRPKLRGEKIDVVTAELSEAEQKAIDNLVDKMEHRSKDEPFLPLFTAGIQLATDMRLVDPSAPFNPKGKIGLAVNNIFDIWTEGNADPAAPNKAQIVFLDMGVPGSKGKRTVSSGKVEAVEEVDIAEQIRQDLMAEANAALGEDADGEVVEVDESDVQAQALLQGKFNLYQDIKDRLIEKGVPAEQIAFIHDAKNDDQKAKMFEKVRAGEIRVLIGSTGKMGVGTNVQRQLIAMHHLDAPWKPADVEQRDGRILRQGNKNPEVRILRYITKKSFDAYRWQLLDRKSNFIGQLFAGALGVRNAEDIDPPLPEAAELKAAATGNPLIVERAELEREVRTLEAAERAHLRGQKQAAINAQKTRDILATVGKYAEAYEADAQLVTDLSGDNFKVDLSIGTGGPITVTERKKAGEAIRAYLMAFAARAYYGRKSDVTLGTISGFEMAAEVERTPDGYAVRPVIAGQESYRPNDAFLLTEASDPSQLIRRWERVVSGVRQSAEAVRSRIAGFNADLPKLEEAAKPKPFAKAGQLVAKQSRLKAVVSALNTGTTPEEMEAQSGYVEQAMANLRATSRTAAGVVDTSASAGKAGQMAEGLTADTAAKAAVENFETTIRDIYRRRDQFATMTPEGLADEADKIAIAINKGILKEGALYRTDDSKKFPYTAVANLMLARDQFFADLTRRLQDPNADPIETAAYIEWRANLGDHFWADGVGKTSKALAYIPLMRAGLPLPKYRANKEFFSYSRKTAADPNNGLGEYLGPEFDRFLDYYRGLMGKPDTSPEGYQRREAAAREIMATDEWVRATIPDKSNETIRQPGYNSPEWRAQRTYNTPEGEVVGYEAGIQYLMDTAAAKVPGGVKSERKIFVLLGKPGSGKSTIAKKVAARHGAMHLVSDDAKLIIPEYDGGKGSGTVHEEASDMMKDVISRMKGSGNNLIVEKLGSSDGSILGLIEAATKKGVDYTVTVLNVDVPMALAMERAIGRWKETGRAVPQSEFDKTALNLPALITKLKSGGLANETATVRFSEAADRWEILDPGLETEGLWDRAGTSEGQRGVDGVDRDQGPDRGPPGRDRGRATQEGVTTEEGAPEAPLVYPPADSYAIRTLNTIDDPVVKGHYEALARSGTAVEPALGAIASDRRLDAGERQQLAELYVGEAVSGDPVEAIRSAAERRGNELTSALLHGFSPEVSPSNLRVRDFDAQMLETAFQRLADRLPNDALLAVRDALRLDVGDEIAALEGAALSAKAARVEFGINAGAAKKVIAISLEYGPDTALRTFTHEEIHLLRGMGIVKGKDWEALAGIAKRRPKKAEATRILDGLIADGKISQESYDTLIGQAGKLTYRELYEVDSRYGDFLKFNEDKLIEETVAHAAADWADGRQFAAPIERVFMRIRDFLEAIQNALNGLGFRSANDIFESIWAGDFVRKFEEAEAKRAEGIDSTREWMGENGVIAMAVGPRPAIGEVWGTKFQTLMSEQYQIAVAGEDLATQYDILSAKYNNALSDPPEMREAMKAEIDRLRPIVETQEAELRADLKRKFSPDGGSAPPMIMAAFAGERATTADLNALNSAKEMDAAGEPREDIWKQTGWFKGVDGRWRFEIDDSKSKLRAFGPDFSLLQVELTHEELFKAYPQMAEVEFNREGAADFEGMFTPGGILPSSIAVAKKSKNRRSTVLHETQHALQDIEGFAEGGSPELEMQNLASDDIWTKLKNRDLAITNYERLAGEVESRTVQKRLSLTPEQRANRAPWLDYDVPESQQIVRMPDGSGQAMASVDLDMSPEARKARAEAMGFDTSKIWYHGTKAKFDAFDLGAGGRVTGAPSSRMAMFFANKPNIASTYAFQGKSPKLLAAQTEAERKAADIEARDTAADEKLTALFDQRDQMDEAAFVSQWNAVLATKPPLEEIMAARFAAVGARGEVNRSQESMDDASIIPTYARVRNPLIKDYAGLEYRDESFADVLAKAQDSGHDGVIFRNVYDAWKMYGGQEYTGDILAVFDPSNIRSVNAEFDPAESDSSVLMASFRDWLPSRGPTPPQATEQGDSPGLNKILSDLKKTLGMPVSQGLWGMTVRQGNRSARVRPPSNVRGQFDRETGNVSVRQSRDIETLAHEGGHYLESILGNELGAVKQQFAEALTGTPNPSGGSLSEGFARWFTNYILDPEAAKRSAPGMTEAFDDVLEAERPDMLEAFDTIQNEYQRYVTSDAAAEANDGLSSQYDGTMFSDLSKDKALDNVQGWISSAYEKIVDQNNASRRSVEYLLKLADFNGLRDHEGRPLSLKASDNFYKRLRMFGGSYGRGRSWLEKGVSDLETGKIIGPSLKEAVEKALGDGGFNKKRYADFNQYLISTRALAEYDRLEQKEATVKQYDDTITKLAAARPNFAARAQQEQATLARREDALIRSQTLLRDRRRMMSSAETRLESVQDRLQGLQDDLVEADEAFRLAGEIADPVASQAVSENYRSMAARRRRSMQIAERDQQQALRLVDNLSNEVSELEVEATTLEAEIVQRREMVDQNAARLAQLDEMRTRLGKERDAVQKRGASKAPTKKPRAWHENRLRKLESPEFQEAAKLVHDFLHALLGARLQAGFISQELFDELSKRKDWYVPFFRDMSDIPGAGDMFNGSGVKKWSMFKKFDGSDRSIIAPLETISQEAYSTAQQIAFNDATKALINLAESVGPGGGKIAERLARTTEMEASQENFEKLKQDAIALGLDPLDAHMLVQRMEMNFSDGDIKVILSPENLGPKALPQLPLWVNGERQMIRLPDKDFGKAIFDGVNAVGKDMSDILLKAFGASATAIRVGATTHWDFIGANLWRDMWQIFKIAGGAPVLTHARGGAIMAGMGDVAGMPAEDFKRLYNEAGGIAGGINVNAQTALQQRDVKDLLDTNVHYKSVAAGAAIGAGLGISTVGAAGGALGLLLGGPVGMAAGFSAGIAASAAIGGYAGRHGEVFKVVEASETAGRLGVAAHAYKRAKAHNPDLTDMEAMFEAAFTARDLLDWSRRGSKMLVISRMVPFLSSFINGNIRNLQQIGAVGDRGSALKRQFDIVWKHKNDEQLSADERRDLVDSFKSYVRWGLLTGVLASMWMVMMAGDDDEDKQTYQDIKDKDRFIANWIKVNGTWVKFPVPHELAYPATAATILGDKLMGYDPRVRERLLDAAYETLTPPLIAGLQQQVGGLLYNSRRDGWFGKSRDVVPERLAKLPLHEQFDAYSTAFAMDLANAMHHAGVAQLSPKKIDFFLTSQFASWGREVGRAYETGKRTLGVSNRPEPRATDLPIVRRFVGDPARASKSVDEVYKIMSTQGGEMTTAAEGYKRMVDSNRHTAAEIHLSTLEPEQKAYALTQLHAAPYVKRRHPLNYAKATNQATMEVQSDIVMDQLAPKHTRNRRKVRDFGREIELTPTKKTEVLEIMDRIRQVDSRNAMVLLNREGFQGLKIKDPQLIWDELEQSSPEVAKHLKSVRRNKKIPEWDQVATHWADDRKAALAKGPASRRPGEEE